MSGFYMRLKLGQSRVIEGLFSSLDGGCPMVRIVIELPDQLKDFGVALQNAAERMAQLAANNSSGKSMDYAKIEREVGDLTVSEHAA